MSHVIHNPQDPAPENVSQTNRLREQTELYLADVFAALEIADDAEGTNHAPRLHEVIARLTR